MIIPYGRQDITDADVAAVVAALRSDFLTQGPAIPQFEAALSSAIGCDYTVAVSSATAALHIACAALGLQDGGLLWTVPNTFVASANCARYCGADVDFVDIDPVTWNMSVDALTEKLDRARMAGRIPDIVVPVHFGGQPTEQEAIWKLSEEYGFKVLEDASHSIGAARNGERVGSCRWSHATVFSFHPVKIVTTGEGGAVTTNDPVVAERLFLLRSHGITRDPASFVLESAGPWYYEQLLLGFNYRITDIQASLGTEQLRRLPDYVAKRNELAVAYDKALHGVPVGLPTVTSDNYSAFHLYVIRIPDDSPVSRRQVVDHLRSGGIMANVHYMPVHLQPYYRSLGFSPGDFPESEAHGRQAVTLPMFPSLTGSQQQTVVAAIRQVVSGRPISKHRGGQ